MNYLLNGIFAKIFETFSGPVISPADSPAAVNLVDRTDEEMYIGGESFDLPW